jgi:hypothetical protein
LIGRINPMPSGGNRGSRFLEHGGKFSGRYENISIPSNHSHVKSRPDCRSGEGTGPPRLRLYLPDCAAPDGGSAPDLHPGRRHDRSRA